MTDTKISLSLAELVNGANLDWCDKNFFRLKRKDALPVELGKVELVDLGRAFPYTRGDVGFFYNPSADNAEGALNRLGYRAANVEELCDWSAKNPGELRGTIVALGSTFKERDGLGTYHPTLGRAIIAKGAKERRLLELCSRFVNWNSPNTLFAAVKICK